MLVELRLQFVKVSDLIGNLLNVNVMETLLRAEKTLDQPSTYLGILQIEI